MNSTDIIGWTSPHGFVICDECAGEVQRSEFFPIFAGEEWNEPGPTCDWCHKPIEGVSLICDHDWVAVEGAAIKSDEFGMGETLIREVQCSKCKKGAREYWLYSGVNEDD